MISLSSLFERPHFSGVGQHGQRAGRRQRRDRYFITGDHGRLGGMRYRLDDQRFGIGALPVDAGG